MIIYEPGLQVHQVLPTAVKCMSSLMLSSLRVAGEPNHSPSLSQRLREVSGCSLHARPMDPTHRAPSAAAPTRRSCRLGDEKIESDPALKMSMETERRWQQ